MDMYFLLFSLLFSTLGLVYLAQAKKRGNNLYFYIAGLSLLGYSYFVTGMIPMIILGILFMALPYILQHYFPL
jgi:hypothetical protein